MSLSPLATLATYLAGEFDNQAQAAADPTWYVHLKLWQAPVFSLSSSRIYTLFLEQANAIAATPSYRQRILQLSEKDGALRAQYFALAAPLKFQGAGADIAQLDALSSADLVSLPNSEAHIEYSLQNSSSAGRHYQFRAALPAGKLCSFEYGGQQKYVYLGFDVAPKAGTIELLTYDKGVDPDTGRGLWGALIGPFCMVKQKDYRW